MITRTPRGVAWIALFSFTAAISGCAPQGQQASTVAALPDWSGEWEIVGSTPSATGGMEQSLEEMLRDMAKWGPPPYKPESAAFFKQVAAAARQVNDATQAGGKFPQLSAPTCTFGFPALMISSPLMFEVLATPKETAMIFSGREMRHIYTDGRPHTAKEELFPTPWGDSIGHWEGQTLVIDTIAAGLPGAVPEGSNGVGAFGGDGTAFSIVAILSPEARFSERLRMIDKDHLENQMTITDPVMFSAPWTINRQYRRVALLNRMVHEDCGGEERNPIVQGRFTLTLPPSPAAGPQ